MHNVAGDTHMAGDTRIAQMSFHYIIDTFYMLNRCINHVSLTQRSGHLI